MLPIAIVAIAIGLGCSSARAGEPTESCAGSELAAGEVLADLDCLVGGAQYRDDDASGSRGPAERGLAGWTVYADFDGDGLRDSGEPATVTGADGSYRLAIPYELALDSFVLRDEVQPGWACSAPAPGCSYAELPFIDDDPEQEPDIERGGRDFGGVPIGAGASAPSASVSGDDHRPGFARLSAAAACPSRFVRMSVRGRAVANVSYFLDGQKLMTVIKPDSRGRFGYRIRSARITPGVHRIRAQVTFTAASATASRTLSTAVQRCRPARPRFAG